MARGDRLSRPDQARIHAAVAEAEATTGLQLCVFVCTPGGLAPRAQAEEAFVRMGLSGRPAVLVMVVPEGRTVEVVTSPEGRERVSDDASQRAVDRMVLAFSGGDLVGGIVEGVTALAEAAGPGQPTGADFPDVIAPD